jgi:hypothetical protein
LFDQQEACAGVGGEGFSFGFATPDGFVGSFKKIIIPEMTNFGIHY